VTKSAKLGQNFLRAGQVARRIVDLLEAPAGPILEIGAGEGMLSGPLLEKFPGRRLVLVEVDPRLVTELERRFAGPNSPRRGGRVEILAGDILQVDMEKLFPGERAAVIGNLPYHISKPLVDWLIAQRAKIGRAVLMLQKDFVDKILAPAGGKNHHAQSVVFQLLFQSRRCFDVPAGAFTPKPKIVSTVIAARPVESPLPDGAEFYDFVKLCFAGRRKTLANNLAQRYPDAVVADLFAAFGLKRDIRAEQLPADRFPPLYAALKKYSGEEG